MPNWSYINIPYICLISYGKLEHRPAARWLTWEKHKFDVEIWAGRYYIVIGAPEKFDRSTPE